MAARASPSTTRPCRSCTPPARCIIERAGRPVGSPRVAPMLTAEQAVGLAALLFAASLLYTSVGHAAVLPVQLSATSQIPADARHSKVAGLKLSVGHAAALPVQLSATSQIPADARHSTVAAWNTSVGHAAALPVQLSATSQIPADARHSTA